MLIKSLRFKLAILGGVSLLVPTLLVALLSTISPSTSVQAASPLVQAAKGKLRPAVIHNGTISRTMPFFSGGALDAADVQNDSGTLTGVEDTLGCSNRTVFHDGSKRVNQDCTFRRQAEELIKANPVNSKNLIAGQNDSRIGFNHCGFDYSFDGGSNWGDGLPPFFQHLNSPQTGHTILGGPGTLHTYDAASDPALTFDSQGNAFYSCVVFDVNTAASGLFVTLSPAPAGGSFYNNVPATGSSYVVVEDNNPAIAHDKEFIVADSFKNSPFHDNVYITWTIFRQDCGPSKNLFCSSPIYFSRSTDHALTWSQPVEISGNNPNLCFQGNVFDPRRNPHDCNFDQGSDPVVLPDGTIVVTFFNQNTAPTNPNAQQLAVRSTDGGLTWSKPTKVGDDVIVGEPQCNFGRGPEECVPGPFIRTNDFPRIAVDRNQGNLYVTWQDYRSGKEFDIQLAQSTDGGKTWTDATSSVNPSRHLDHYEPAVDVTNRKIANGVSNVAVSYYRSRQPTTSAQIGTLGQDYALAGGKGLTTPYQEVQVAPLTPSPDGIQAGFNGDYSGLVVVGTEAYPIWSDTRNKVPPRVGVIAQGVTHDEDVFTRGILVPNP